LPAGQAASAGEAGHQPSRDRAAENAAKGACEKHDGDRPSHARRTVPAGEVIDHARGETGFEDTEQKTHSIKHRYVAYEQHARRSDPPQNHDAAEGFPRADSRQHQVAGDFKQYVSDEKDTGAYAIGRVGKSEIALHLEFGEADIDSVQIRKDIAKQQKRQQPPVELVVKGADVICSIQGLNR
jgi:hypothetical protein